MIRDWSAGVQGKHNMPQPEVVQGMAEMSLAIRSLAGQKQQPIQIKLEVSDLAKALLAEVDKRQAALPRQMREPALPFGINPVRLPIGVNPMRG